MNLAANKAVIHRFYDEVWNRGNVEVAREIFHDDYVRHDLRPSQAEPGAQGQVKVARDFRLAFPDLSYRVDMLIAEGDLVVSRWTAAGTHRGAWAGLAPSGKRIEFSGVNIFRLRDGKVAEVWNHRDDLGVASQLGLPIYAGAAAPAAKA